ncbi:MAG: Xaa-Pro peptidase family protein [Armatimonadota bacterium]|nr:Xaa-Pro peptidase family protein [Armatimonadota bacterium]
MSRLERLRARMREAAVPALLVTDRPNRAYLTGFVGSLGWAIVTPDRQMLLVDDRYTEQAAAEATGWDVVRCEFGALLDGGAVTEPLRRLKVGRLGVEVDKITVTLHEGVARAAAAAGATVFPAAGHVEALRQIKEPDEIARIEAAARVAEAAIAACLPMLRPGATEQAFAWALERHCREAGASGMAFNLIGSGPRSALPHCTPTGRALEPGDLVLVDIGPIVNGYHADITRMFVVGEPQPWQREIHAIALEAQARAIAACRPGVRADALDAIARDHIARAGYGDQFLHLLGHGIGAYGTTEDPKIMPGVADVLRPGMVITIEPGIYLSGRGGARVEETVLVTEDGCRLLTRLPHDLQRTA